MVMYDSTDPTTYRSTTKLKVCKERCFQNVVIRCVYITYYNTPDNLRIALEDNLIEISAKNSENHNLRINTNTFVQIALQCNAASYVMSCMYQLCLPCAFVLLTLFSILQVWIELIKPRQKIPYTVP